MSRDRRRATAALLALLAAGVPALALPAAGAPQGSTPAATFVHYVAPEGLADLAYEPTLGVNWRTGKVLYQANLETLQVSFDDSQRPARAIWKDVSRPPTNLTTADPILETDPVTGRTLVSQLAPPCSLAALTDSDGEPTPELPTGYAPSAACGVGSNGDHQSVHYGRSVTPNPLYGPDRVAWYCSHVTLEATCSVSRDGGTTFLEGSPAYVFNGGAPFAVGDVTFTTPNVVVGCLGLHGHLNSSPVDGTAYLPNASCNAEGDLATNRPAVVVSSDEGRSWDIRRIPDATAPDFDSDPAVDVDEGNRAYVAYENATSNLLVTSTSDRGETFTPSFDLGASAGLRNVAFPAVQAGSAGRAAVAFLGAVAEAPLHAGPDPEPENQLLTFDPDGDDPHAGWHLYVAMTYDGGRTWTTSDLTPDDPVQRGCIYWGIARGSQPAEQTCLDNKRNLRDFFDIAVERDGRVVVSWADGCIGRCVREGHTRNTNVRYDAREARDAALTEAQFDELYSQSTKGVLTRQQCGRGLYAGFDAASSGPVRACAGSPATRPPAAGASATGPASVPAVAGGRLPATGLLGLLPALGLGLLAAGAWVRRRRG